MQEHILEMIPDLNCILSTFGKVDYHVLVSVKENERNAEELIGCGFKQNAAHQR